MEQEKTNLYNSPENKRLEEEYAKEAEKENVKEEREELLAKRRDLLKQIEPVKEKGEIDMDLMKELTEVEERLRALGMDVDTE